MSNTICGVTAEFNPFHEGHAHLLHEARRITGADHVMVLMSPDFVQRGGPAIDDKYTRAAAALDAGADCVLEFPVRFATGAAGTFARAAVTIFAATGLVNTICFGSEAGHLEPLQALSSCLADETPAFRKTIQEAMRSGKSYPAAIERALREHFPNGDELADAYAEPNDRLGIEYLNALREHPGIKAFTVPLIPGIHASDLRVNRFASGRRGLNANDFSAVLFARLTAADISHSKLESSELLTRYEDVNADLAARILREKDLHPSFQELASCVKTKAYTRSRIDRALTHILLGIPGGTRPDEIPYLRVLGFRRSFRSVLGKLSEQFAGTLILRSDDLSHLDERAQSLYRQDLYASELWRGIRMIKYPDEERREERSMGVIVRD